MIRDEEWKFDFEDCSFLEKIARCSIPYELDENDEANLRMINDYLTNDKYASEKSISAHREYIMHLIDRMAAIKREEAAFFPQSISLDMQISRLVGLSRRLAEKEEELASA